VLPVWIFIICGQLCIFYTRELITNLNLFCAMVRNAGVIPSRTVAQRTFSNLRSLKQLYLAADLLHRHFSTILVVNCFLTFITMLTSSYYVIEFSQRGFVAIVCWEASHVLDSFVRFWLICHTSDRIRESVIIDC
jgi:hypothetical protein